MQQDDLRARIQSLLIERFPDAAIRRVAIQSDLDSDGDKILRITVVFDGADEALGGENLVSIVRHLRPVLSDAHREEFPLLSFVSTKDAKNMKFEAV